MPGPRLLGSEPTEIWTGAGIAEGCFAETVRSRFDLSIRME